MRTTLMCWGLVFAATGALAQDAPLKIGVVLPLSGPTSHYGTEALRGLNLAVDQINARGGVRGSTLDLIVEDNAGDPAVTSQKVSDLIRVRQVLALIGPITSTNAAAAASVAQQARTPLILPAATSPYVTEIGEYICRICFTDPLQSRALTKFAREYLKAERAAVIYEAGSSYSEKLAEFFIMRFKDLGGSIVFAESFRADTAHLAELVARAVRSNPDVLFAPVYYREAAIVVNRVADLGSRVTLLGGDGWESSELFRLAGSRILPNQVYISSHFSLPLLTDRGSTFVADFMHKHGAPPSAVAALAYDAGMVLADALGRATGLSRDALQQALVSTNAFPGVTGTISINEKRDVSKDVHILRAASDRFVHETTVSSGL